MKKEKAKKLDRILKVLTTKRDDWKTRDDISKEIGESVSYPEMSIIRNHNHGYKPIVRNKTVYIVRSKKRAFALTYHGSAFRDDGGFESIHKEKSREKCHKNAHLIVTIILGVLAIVAFCRSFKQESKYTELEKRIDTVEQYIND
ncbi:hypothetical protein ES705_35194 [subsurface metagenome]